MTTQNVYLSVLWMLSGGLACAQTGVISTYAGTGSAGYSGDGGTALSAMLNGPGGLAVDSNGNLFIADTNNSRIRKVSGGIMTTVAGGGTGGDGGLATAAQLQNPCDVKVDSAGNLYISESCVSASGGTGGGGTGTGGSVVNRIRRVDAATGIITTIAGSVTGGFAGDGGPATSALLNTPGALALDGAGNIYVADFGNNRVRRIDAITGVITTVAGSGAAAFAGDGGPAVAASLNLPTAVALDSAGNLYIAETNRIRRVDAGTGIITTLAGTGSSTFNGDGIPATGANLGSPTALQVNGAGNLLLTDSLNDRVLLVDTSTGLIWTIAGHGALPPFCCSVGDGNPATLAWLNVPAGIALSPTGPLFISEHAGQRVRQVALQNPLVSTAVNLSASGASVPGGSPLTLTAVLSVMKGSSASVAGSIHFVEGEGGPGIGVAPLVNGVASFTTSSLQGGVHNITGQYFGDSVFVASISLPVSVTITAPQSSVALAANPSPAVANQPVTLTATVTPSTATRSVSFFNGTASLGMANISNGTATLTGVTFTAGSYSLTAQYQGDIFLPTSTSPAIILNVKAASSVALTSSVNPSTVGQTVTFTATVTPSTAGGTFQFMDNGAAIGTSSTNQSPAFFSISTLTPGTHAITVSYGGDANNSPATSVAFTQTVLVSSSVVVTSSLNPSPVGGPVTFTASVSPATASGTVQFVDGATVLGIGTLAGGSALFTTSTLAQGTRSITAVYSGDANNAASTSAAIMQTVKQTTALSLVSSLNPSTVGQAVTFTANINPAATGTIQFLDGATVLATVPVSSGAAVFSTSALTLGTHSITATYSGDTNYLSAQSSTLTETVNLVATTTTLAATPNPAFVGGAVSLLATVTPATATGTVQFLDGTTVLGTGNLSNGSASFSTSALAQGAHSITAVYGGDTADAGSTSAVVSQSMKLSAGMTTGLNPSPGVTGQNVTLTANLIAAATGTVTFTDGGTVLATVAVASGTASYSTTALTQGSHTLGISYSGDSTYMSQSTTIPEKILGATSITVASNANPAVTGQTVTFTATVTPAAAVGNVQFFDGQTSLIIVALNGGTASYSTSALSAGTHSITANYLGSPDYTSSNSNTVAEVVKTNTSVALASGWNPSLVGGAVTFNAVVTPATATGTVQFLDGNTVLGAATLASGSASFTTSVLTQGAHSITAVYSGDAANAGATSAVLSQSVKLLVGLDVVVSPSPAVAGQPITIRATMNAAATGTVTFSDGSTVLANVPVASGVAAYSTVLTAGVHMLSIGYGGDATYMSSGTSFAQTVLAASAITLTSGPNPSIVGQSVTFAATVTPSTVTGTVQFLNLGTVIGTATLTSGTAVFSTSSLAAGAYSITASYSGDSKDTPATSAAVLQTVKAKSVASISLISSANPSTVGQAVTFTASVTPSTATGTVQFLDGNTVLGTVAVASGAAAFPASQLAQGSHSITASYSGDANDTAATSATLSQTVNPVAAPSTLTATAAGSSQINLAWTASITSGVTYDVYSSTVSGFTPSASNRIASGVTAKNYAAMGLNPSTKYYFRVTAVNAGGESAATNQASATTAAVLSCHVNYSVTDQWNDGFEGAFSIKNTGSTAVNSWTLTWIWPGNQVMTQSWNSNFTQSGANVTLKNANWNSTLAPGATLTGMGFLASYSGSNHPPTAFYVNGTLCH